MFIWDSWIMIKMGLNSIAFSNFSITREVVACHLRNFKVLWNLEPHNCFQQIFILNIKSVWMVKRQRCQWSRRNNSIQNKIFYLTRVAHYFNFNKKWFKKTNHKKLEMKWKNMWKLSKKRSPLYWNTNTCLITPFLPLYNKS